MPLWTFSERVCVRMALCTLSLKVFVHSFERKGQERILTTEAMRQLNSFPSSLVSSCNDLSRRHNPIRVLGTAHTAHWEGTRCECLHTMQSSSAMIKGYVSSNIPTYLLATPGVCNMDS